MRHLTYTYKLNDNLRAEILGDEYLELSIPITGELDAQLIENFLDNTKLSESVKSIMLHEFLDMVEEAQVLHVLKANKH